MTTCGQAAAGLPYSHGSKNPHGPAEEHLRYSVVRPAATQLLPVQKPREVDVSPRFTEHGAFHRNEAHCLEWAAK